MNKTTETVQLTWWRWAYRLTRVLIMIVLAYWLSRTGETFFYQGF